MSRKTKDITIPGERVDEQGSRDNGKTFRLTEMAAKPAEKWANRVFLALARSGLDLPSNLDTSGMSGIRQLAHLVGHLRFPELDPLMDELMGCILFVGDRGFTRKLIEDGGPNDDIEEATTRYFLRQEVIDLHVNFSVAARIFNLIAVASTMTDFETISESAPTSRRPSRRLSKRA